MEQEEEEICTLTPFEWIRQKGFAWKGKAEKYLSQNKEEIFPYDASKFTWNRKVSLTFLLRIVREVAGTQHNIFPHSTFHIHTLQFDRKHSPALWLPKQISEPKFFVLFF